jgi:hypothetical protein
MTTRAIALLTLILFSSTICYSQEGDSHLTLYKYGTSKTRKIKKEKFVTVNMNSQYQTYGGFILDVSDSNLCITKEYHTRFLETDTTEIEVNYSYTGSNLGPTIQLSLSDVNYVKYEPEARTVFASIGAFSLLTSLIVAPLVSFGYKTGEFNSDRYLTIMKYSLPLTAVGFSLSIVFGSRKFSVRPMN